ncbi:hypothetical protein B0H66DRAFT_631090, partial [Apodospora peruviana]
SSIRQHSLALLVLASQVTAAAINAAAKYVETIHGPTSQPETIHPFMILHVRMLITGLGCTLFLFHRDGNSSKSDALFGSREVRSLILLRALGGVCGASGFFFSLKYLTLSEATALNFLGPLGSLVTARWLSFATVRWTDCLGTLGALVGVVLVVSGTG